jgi:hypothetical protein
MTRRPEWLSSAEHAVDERTAPEAGERKFAAGRDAHTLDREALRQEQQDEVAHSWAGFGMVTDGQFKGGVLGSLAGALVGALIFLPLGLIDWGYFDLGWRLAIAAIAGALAGGTALAVYLGGREPELEGEMQDVDGRPSSSTTLRDPGTDPRGR